MKKFSAIIIAMALVLGMSQCKKQETPTATNSEDGMVYITVNVENGGKHHIEPSVGAYIFTNGDVLYVGNDGHYVGSLTYANGAFSGEIASPSTEDYLHFYFTGGKTPETAPTEGATTDFTVSIADQSGNLPVLAYGHSTAKYSDANASYSTTLRNKCALVKFDIALGTSNAVTVSNMLTTATVDFATPGITPVTNTTGAITLYSESETEKWAILLPQDNPISSFTVNIGNKSYTVTGSYSITNNGYINSGIEVENFTTVNLGELADNYEAQDGDLLTGTLGSAYQISIAAGATVVLRDANINGNGSMSSGSCAGITCPGDATIVLKGSNKVSALGENYPGIFIAPNYTLTIQGDGSLDAEGDWGAGIGGGYNIACGNIVIKGGNITAENGRGSAAIGAGYNASGNGADCGYIRIEGGIITADASYTIGGSGIGSGDNSSCGDITISGGTVTANGGGNAAGIGEGLGGSCGDITIGYGIKKVIAKIDKNLSDKPYPQCIGKSHNSQNTVKVSVASGLSDQESNGTRTIQH